MEPYYRDYATWLVQTYGQRVYKLPITIADGTCPNRDGRIAYGGCSFCDASGSGFQCLPQAWAISEQLAENKAFYQRRFKAGKFIAYLQTFSNTYMPLADFRQATEEATEDPDLVGLSVSTRPDCLHPRYLDHLAELAKRKNLAIDIELGLQTVNYRTLTAVNRGHTLAEFIDAVRQSQARGFAVTAHVILNLPGDEMIDVIETAKILSSLEVDFVKLHSLYIVAGTPLAKSYVNGDFAMISLDAYVERVVTFLAYLHPDIVIQRLVGKGPQEDLIFCNWDTSWWKIKDAINDLFAEKGWQQGSLCNYLGGAAVAELVREEVE